MPNTRLQLMHAHGLFWVLAQTTRVAPFRRSGDGKRSASEARRQEKFPHARAVCRHSAWALARAADDHDEISVSPGDLRDQARGLQPGELLVEFAGVIDLRVDCRHNIRGIDGLHDVGQDETAGRVELAGDASEEIGLACAFEVMNCKSRYDEIERPFRQGILQSAY